MTGTTAKCLIVLICPKRYWHDRQTDLIICLTVTGTGPRLAITGFIAWFIIEWGHYTDEPDGLDYMIPFPVLLDRPEPAPGLPRSRVVADVPLNQTSLDLLSERLL